MSKLNEFGGSLLKKGKRKTARPLQFKAPTHLVLKADNRLQLFRNSKTIKALFKKYSHRFGVTNYSMAVQEDHIHAVVRFFSRISYRAWIRALTSALSRKVKGVKWRFSPYTKFITWGKQFTSVLKYLKANHDQAEFLIQSWDRYDRFANELSRWFKLRPGLELSPWLELSMQT